MSPFLKLGATFAVPVIGFAGVLTLLPKSWAYGPDGTVSNLGVFLSGAILLGLMVILYHAWKPDAED